MNPLVNYHIGTICIKMVLVFGMACCTYKQVLRLDAKAHHVEANQ